MVSQLSPRSRARARQRSEQRWIGVGTLATAVVLLLALGSVRARFSEVPDLAWFALLATQLVAGGAMTALGLPTAPARMTRHRAFGRSAVLVGGTALAFGLVPVSAHAGGWSDRARAVGALAFCAALALLPFGVALLRRTGRDARRAHAVDRDAHVPFADPGSVDTGSDEMSGPRPR